MESCMTNKSRSSSGSIFRNSEAGWVAVRFIRRRP